jgi:septal ring factor EnvC (AmiA/AmiB activator)
MCGLNCRHRLAAALVGLCTLLLLLYCSGQASAAAFTGEPMYMVSQSEMERLSNNLIRLKKLNEESQTQLTELRKELATSRTELTEARKQSNELMNELNQLQAASKKQEASLMIANESLKKYGAEEKRTRLRIKAQRNTWEAIAAGLLVAWAAK